MIFTAQEMTEKVAASTSVFAANVAQTLRFGQIITGNDIGQHLLGVSYQSMLTILGDLRCTDPRY